MSSVTESVLGAGDTAMNNTDDGPSPAEFELSTTEEGENATEHLGWGSSIT